MGGTRYISGGSIGTGGGNTIDGTISIGTENESIDSLSLQIGMITGGENENGLNNITSTVGLDSGIENESILLSNNTGTEFILTGNENEIIDSVSFNLSPQNVGTVSKSILASSLINATKFTSSTATVINSGTINWVNPTNAQGDFDTVLTTFTVPPGTTGNSGNATLKCLGILLNTSATPIGFTKTNTSIVINHRWLFQVTLTAVDISGYTLELRDAVGVLISTISSRNINSPDATTQSTLLKETFNITSSVTDAQLSAGIQIWANCSINIASATNSTNYYYIDAIMLQATYTKTGIN